MWLDHIEPKYRHNQNKIQFSSFLMKYKNQHKPPIPEKNRYSTGKQDAVAEVYLRWKQPSLSFPCVKIASFH